MAMNEFRIRDYTGEDCEKVLELWSLTGMGGAERGDDGETIENSLVIGGRLLVMTERETDILIGTSWMTFDGRRIHMHHFGIHPDYQGRGLSKPLLRESLFHVKQTGYQVKLEVHNSNDRAINLYKGMGFKYLGDYDVYIIRDPDGIEPGNE